MTIDLFDYNYLCFVQLFAYINENVLYTIDNIFYFYNIKTFSNNNVIDNIKIKTYTRINFFIRIKK